MINNNLRNPNTFYEDAAKYRIKLYNTTSCVAIVRIENVKEIYANHSDSEFSLILLQLRDFFKKSKTNLGNCEMITQNDDLFLFALMKILPLTPFKKE